MKTLHWIIIKDLVTYYPTQECFQIAMILNKKTEKAVLSDYISITKKPTESL